LLPQGGFTIIESILEEARKLATRLKDSKRLCPIRDLLLTAAFVIGDQSDGAATVTRRTVASQTEGDNAADGRRIGLDVAVRSNARPQADEAVPLPK
jgi:hypothetical protein